MSANEPMQPLLKIENLDVRYGENPALQGISLEIQRGAFACLIGPNGAGKSTLLKAIVGLVKPSAGRIISGATQIGYVPQQLPLDHSMPLTVAEFLSLRLTRSRFWFGVGGRKMRDQISVQLGEIGAQHLADRRLGQLSGGEFQRILVAYALLNHPDLLLLDEPLTGVDIRGGMSFDGLLHHLHDHKKITIVMVSHDLHLVEHVSDTVYCINRDLCCYGNPNEILKPENLAKAYGHLPGMVAGGDGDAFIPVSSIR